MQEVAFICYDCGKTFTTEATLKRHRTKAHLPAQDPQWFAAGTVCACCQTDFRTRVRLVRHLRHRKTGCMTYYLAHHAPSTQTKSARGWQRTRRQRSSSRPLDTARTKPCSQRSEASATTLVGARPPTTSASPS